MEEFSFLTDINTRRLIQNGYRAVDELELWSWLKTFEPENGSFMFCNHPNVILIGNKMHELPDPPGHSGSSFSFTMKHLHFIAKNGIHEYKNEIIRNG